MDIFGFFPITQADTQDAGALASDLARAFSESASDYGTGVKSITVRLILTDPDDLGRGHKLTKPRFFPGTRIVRAHGIEVKLEDELEFSLRPALSDVKNAQSKTEVSLAIADAIEQVRPDLNRMCIPDFDMELFIADFESFFRTVGVGSCARH